MASVNSSHRGARKLGKSHLNKQVFWEVANQTNECYYSFIPPIMTNASLILLWCLCGIVFYFFGKTFRRWSANSNVHRM
jgi:hypothetical protein